MKARLRLPLLLRKRLNNKVLTPEESGFLIINSDIELLVATALVRFKHKKDGFCHPNFLI